MDEIEKLYGVLKEQGLYTKSLDEFKQKYNDPQNQQKLYDVVSEKQLYTKSKEDFTSKYFASSEKKNSIGTSQNQSLGSEANTTDGSSATPKQYENKPVLDDKGEQVYYTDKQTGELKPATQKVEKGLASNSEYAVAEKEQKAKTPQTVEEKKSYLSNLGTNFKAGLNDFNKMITSIPETVYDVFALPQNAVAWATGADIETSSKKFKTALNIKNPILDAYAKEGEKLEVEIGKFNQENYESSSIYDNVKKGNYTDAFELIASSVVRSAPVSVSMMVGGATMKTSELATVGTIAFTNPNKEQLDQENPDMSEMEKTIKAIGLSGAEMVFSAIGEGTIGNVYKDIIKKEGVEVGKDIFKKGLIESYKKALKKYGVVAGAGGEMLEEGATQITQNMINGKPYMEGVFDAMAVGGASGTVMSAPITVNNIKNLIKSKQASKTMSNETKTKINDIDNAVEKLDNDLKQDIPGHIKEKLQVVKSKLETEKENAIESDYDKFKNLPQEQKDKLGDLEDKLDVLKTEYDDIENNQSLSSESKDLLKREKSIEAEKLLNSKKEIIDAKTEKATTQTQEQAVETATPKTEVKPTEGVKDVVSPTVGLNPNNTNEAIQKGDTKPNADISIGDNQNIQQGKDNAVQPIVDVNTSEATVNQGLVLTNNATSINNKLKPKNIKGIFLTETQRSNLEKEIKSKYVNNSLEQFDKNKDDIRQKIFNYDQPIAKKTVNGVELRIAEGLIRNKNKTYLLYADGKIVGEFNSVKETKDIIDFIESNLVDLKTKPLLLESKDTSNGTVEDLTTEQKTQNKPDIKLTFVTKSELRNSTNIEATLKKSNEIKEDYKEIKKLMDCLWK